MGRGSYAAPMLLPCSSHAAPMRLPCGLKPYLKPIVIVGGSRDFSRYSSLYRVQSCEPH